MDEQENLKLSVTNFGPIAKAEIDLRPLTVFVGPSNTGKSYLAILIYALHKFFSGRRIESFRYGYMDRTIFSRRYGSEDLTISPKQFEILRDWIDHTILQSENKDPKGPINILPTSIADIVRPLLNHISSQNEMWNDTVAWEFGVEDTGGLVRNRISSGASVVIDRSITPNFKDQPFRYRLTIKGTQPEILSDIPKAVPLSLLEEYAHTFHRMIQRSTNLSFNELRSDDEKSQYLVRSILTMLTEAVGSSIVNPLTCTAYYLPADRTGLLHANEVVVRSLIAQTPRAGPQYDTLLPQLSGVLADFLDQLIGLGDKKIKNPSGKIATKIEKDILHGEVIVERSKVGYPRFFYRPIDWKHDNIRLINTSSMVSELAPVVLYLRHVVRPGEVLIIEEPESHLHPGMQVEFTRHLAAAVKAGIRVIITTHSEWILDELVNLIYASELPKTRREGIPGADQALEPEEVGAWLFEPKSRPKGSVVKEIKFDTDYAGFRSGFDAVAIGTHNSYAEISDRLEEIASR